MFTPLSKLLYPLTRSLHGTSLMNCIFRLQPQLKQIYFHIISRFCSAFVRIFVICTCPLSTETLIVCNRTWFGDTGKTYEIELDKPKTLPFICHFNITAAGGYHGDIIQVRYIFCSFYSSSSSSFSYLFILFFVGISIVIFGYYCYFKCASVSVWHDSCYFIYITYYSNFNWFQFNFRFAICYVCCYSGLRTQINKTSSVTQQ